MIIDAHHHFWDPSRRDYPWMGDEVAAIRRPFGPDDLRPALGANGVDKTVLVQTVSSLEVQAVGARQRSALARLDAGRPRAVCAASYGQVMQALRYATSALSASERDAVFGGNAVRVYGLTA